MYTISKAIFMFSQNLEKELDLRFALILKGILGVCLMLERDRESLMTLN